VKSGSIVAPWGLSGDPSTWLSAGPGPLSLVAKPSTVTQYLGLNYQAPAKHSMFVGNHCKWNTVVFTH
jgi:hypothetical protein